MGREKDVMRLVYIAGPYRADTWNGVWANIMRARDIAMQYHIPGESFAVCPHLNSMLMDGLHGIEPDHWLGGDIELLKRLDAIVMMPGWESSEGAQGELAAAKEAGLEVIFHGEPSPYSYRPWYRRG